MIYGLFLDSRAWKIDFTSSSFWDPKKYGVQIDLHPDPINIPKLGIDKKYKFVIATEIWEIPARKALQYLRDKGLKIFLAAREPFKTSILKDAMFSHGQFLWNGEYYFQPDMVLAAGQAYAELWKDKAKVCVTGYPRFDYYVDRNRWRSAEDFRKDYGIAPNKFIIFFPSYPPYHYKKMDGKDTMIDLFDAREEILMALRDFSKENHVKYQTIVKIHPASMKLFLKGKGTGKEVAGMIKHYYEKPTHYMKVLGDDRLDSTLARELIVNSNAVCGFTSTMLLEAGIFPQKPVFHILFGNTNGLNGIPEYASHLPTAYNREELFYLLNNPWASNSNPMVEKYLHKIDGKVCERMMDCIKEQI